jgi:hypothetical protein
VAPGPDRGSFRTPRPGAVATRRGGPGALDVFVLFEADHVPEGVNAELQRLAPRLRRLLLARVIKAGGPTMIQADATRFLKGIATPIQTRDAELFSVTSIESSPRSRSGETSMYSFEPTTPASSSIQTVTTWKRGGPTMPQPLKSIDCAPLWCGRSWEDLGDRRCIALAHAQSMRGVTATDADSVVASFLAFFAADEGELFSHEEDGSSSQWTNTTSLSARDDAPVEEVVRLSADLSIA